MILLELNKKTKYAKFEIFIFFMLIHERLKYINLFSVFFNLATEAFCIEVTDYKTIYSYHSCRSQSCYFRFELPPVTQDKPHKPIKTRYTLYLARGTTEALVRLRGKTHHFPYISHTTSSLPSPSRPPSTLRPLLLPTYARLGSSRPINSKLETPTGKLTSLATPTGLRALSKARTKTCHPSPRVR